MCGATTEQLPRVLASGRCAAASTPSPSSAPRNQRDLRPSALCPRPPPLSYLCPFWPSCPWKKRSPFLLQSVVRAPRPPALRSEHLRHRPSPSVAPALTSLSPHPTSREHCPSACLFPTAVSPNGPRVCCCALLLCRDPHVGRGSPPSPQAGRNRPQN